MFFIASPATIPFYNAALTFYITSSIRLTTPRFKNRLAYLFDITLYLIVILERNFATIISRPLARYESKKIGLYNFSTV